MLDRLSMQRWADVDNGAAEVNRMYTADSPYPEMPDGVEGLNVEWYTFYALERGWHPNAGGAFTAISNMAFMNSEPYRRDIPTSDTFHSRGECPFSCIQRKGI